MTGKQATATDPNGNVTTYTYDVLDRLATVTGADGRKVTTAYDALSRKLSVSNLAIQTAPLQQQSYTPDGQVGSMTDANGNATSFLYDGFNRLSTATYPGGSTETATYDANANVLTRKTRANQAITFTYDTLGRLSTKSPPSPAATATYGYDLANRITSVGDTSAAVAAAVPTSGSFVQYTIGLSYDALNRPTGVTWDPAPTQASPSTGSVTFGHAYNKLNQRTGQIVTDNTWLEYPAATPSSVGYTANALNQYTAVGAITPTYDNNGNLTSDGTFTLGYDAENRMVSASGAGNTASYAYDAQGRRKSKTVNGATTAFVTGADNRELLEYDGATGAILRWYAYGLGSNNVLNQMNVAVGSRATFVVDLQGSMIATLDSSTGAFIKSGYLPYGGSTSTASTFRYTGQRIDAETGGLYYYRARTYSPKLGRFVQVDPIGYSGGVNPYAYVGNDPLNFTDPTGQVADAIVNFIGNNSVAVGATLVLGGAALAATGFGAPPGLALAGTGGTLIAGVAVVDATAVGVGVAAVGVGTVLMNQNQGGGSENTNQSGSTQNTSPPLRRLHSDETTMSSNLSGYNYWSSRSTQEIIESLRAGTIEPLSVNSRGTVMGGNTRIMILQQRGFDVNSLPRVPYP
jgi:RHS repeat-associated protein